MRCKLCEEYYKKYPLQKNYWDNHPVHKIDRCYSMSPIQCAFDGKFEDNWNCQTVNLIREICYEGQDLPRTVHYQFCNDQKYATIRIDDIMINDEYIGRALWISWYKNRGRTDALWILDDYDKPRRPREEELLAIVKYYEKRIK